MVMTLLNQLFQNVYTILSVRYMTMRKIVVLRNGDMRRRYVSDHL